MLLMTFMIENGNCLAIYGDRLKTYSKCVYMCMKAKKKKAE